MTLSNTDKELVKVAMMGVGIIALRAAVILLVGLCWIFYL